MYGKTVQHSNRAGYGRASPRSVSQIQRRHDNHVQQSRRHQAAQNHDGHRRLNFAAGLAAAERERNQGEAGRHRGHENRDESLPSATLGGAHRTFPEPGHAALLAGVLLLWGLSLIGADVSRIAGFGLLVATLGFSLQEGGGGGFHIGHAYGSTIGFALAAALAALALLRSRLPALDWRRMAVRLTPIAACAAYLAIIVLPMWGVSQEPFHTPPIYPPLSWLTIAGALLGIHLLGLWFRGIAGAPGSADLVLIPLGLLALASVDLLNQREEAATWGRVGLVSVCLLLALLGRIEQRGGLETVRIPNALRLDRL